MRSLISIVPRPIHTSTVASPANERAPNLSRSIPLLPLPYLSFPFSVNPRSLPLLVLLDSLSQQNRNHATVVRFFKFGFSLIFILTILFYSSCASCAATKLPPPSFLRFVGHRHSFTFTLCLLSSLVRFLLSGHSFLGITVHAVLATLWHNLSHSVSSLPSCISPL